MSAAAHNDEAAFNALLAVHLERRHPRWTVTAEQTRKLKGKPRAKPDIVITPTGTRAGLPVVLETEWPPAAQVDGDAASRIGRTLVGTSTTIHQVVAVRLPGHLEHATTVEMDTAIPDATFGYRLLAATPQMRTEGQQPADAGGLHRYPNSGWIAGSVDDLAGFCERIALNEHLVDEAADVLEDAVTTAAAELRRHLADGKQTVLDDVANALHQEDSEQTTVMGVTVIANALLFQAAIAGTSHGGYVVPDHDHTVVKREVLDTWDRILAVNYWPIFDTARHVLAPIPAAEATPLLTHLTGKVSDLASYGVTSTGDMAGQVFGRLIADRKLLATFYTRPAAAALLAELAVARVDLDYTDTDAVAALKVADLACGTGTLLTAAYQRITARARRAGITDETALHQQMVEHALVGADIMPAAVHLTATLLASLHPSVPFGDTRVFLMPYGDDDQHGTSIGSLELLDDGFATTLWGPPQAAVSGTTSTTRHNATRPVIDHSTADLVIMNPPFTRPTGHEGKKKVGKVPVPSFAGFNTSDDEQRLMSRRLKQLSRRTNTPVSTDNAGLAFNFAAIADHKVKPGGTVALVLPATMVSGKSGDLFRQQLAARYTDISVVSIAATGSTERAFSADTGMAECLVLATKRDETDDDETPDSSRVPVLYANLDNRPADLVEGVEVARSILTAPDTTTGPLVVGDDTVGSYVRATFADTGAAGASELDLIAPAASLNSGELWLPRIGQVPQVRTTQLGQLGQRGPYHMDVNGWHVKGANRRPRGPFDIHRTTRWRQATYPCLWWHNHAREIRLVVEPDSLGRVRQGCDYLAIDVWRTASRLHYNRDFQFNSQPLAACRTEEPCLGGRAWPAFSPTNPEWEPLLVLWANSTLGLLSWWWLSTRQQLGRGSVPITLLPSLVTIDPRQLTRPQIAETARLFDEFAGRDLLPAHQACDDPARRDLDATLLVGLLGCDPAVLTALDVLRRQWCSEPSVHGGQHTQP